MKQPIFKGSKPEKNPTCYNNDGYGRDTYISYNNGGNFQTEFRFLTTPKDRSSMQMMPSQLPRSPNVPQRIFYHSDGSGRDTYVIQNVQERFSTSVNFKRLLRSQDQMRSEPRLRYALPPLAKEKFRQTYMMQTSLSKRLSMPKMKSIS